MSAVETAPVKEAASGPELALWSVLVFLAGAIPGLGLALGILLALTRLQQNRVARLLLPALGAVATVVWAIGLLGGFDGSGAGPPTRV